MPEFFDISGWLTYWQASPLHKQTEAAIFFGMLAGMVPMTLHYIWDAPSLVQRMKGQLALVLLLTWPVFVASGFLGLGLMGGIWLAANATFAYLQGDFSRRKPSR